MKKALFLFLLSSVFVSQASADGIGAICNSSPELASATNGQFQAAIGTCAGFLFGTELFIDGPAGLEILPIGKSIDAVHAFYLNDRGELVATYEATGDKATFVAAYTGPGMQDILGIGGAYLPFSTITSDWAGLWLDPGPVLSDPREPYETWVTESILATGITDSGIVEGDEQYGYDYAFVSQHVTWNFQPATVTEPSILLLLIPGLLALAALKLKRAPA